MSLSLFPFPPSWPRKDLETLGGAAGPIEIGGFAREAGGDNANDRRRCERS